MTIRTGGGEPRVEETVTCIDCIMAWLLYGDGAKCLAGHGQVYFKTGQK